MKKNIFIFLLCAMSMSFIGCSSLFAPRSHPDKLFTFFRLDKISTSFRSDKSSTCFKAAPYKKQKVRVTFYCAAEDKKWGNRIATSSKRAKEGKTIAVNPKEIPYQSDVFIPFLQKLDGDGLFVAEDTGSALLTRKASKGKTPVIDIYVSSRQKMLAWAKLTPPYLDVFTF